VKDVLPLDEQITQLKIGVGELLAFHCAVYEKADMEKIPLDTGYKIVEDIRDYSQLGGLKHEQNRLQQQIFMSQMFIGSRQATLESLAKLQSLGVRDEVIQNMARLIDLVKLGSSLSKEHNGNSNSGNTNSWDILSPSRSCPRYHGNAYGENFTYNNVRFAGLSV